ncbi:MAG: GTP cyclohydrolase I FolE2 [Thermodesulfobacterium geofontis]|uniref:GTP cyclohydrolase FolE2 n=1 Tax=Thermodesulfobacterium geofontis TaxID=1295609 RepID=A0A2N7QFF5_9BACT|nr:MAG: GTP cyclohydrolase I FolE2 [Thermodesulfobacterium geofontis]PMP97583.1 MAG: GTP cyclohydrolase I FolE2 [Thermodesulfobacterium geofontis]
MELEDIQSLTPEEKIPLDKVGIKGFKYPVTVLDQKKGFQHTVAEINLYVDLPSKFKGTHMSRFIEVLNEFGSEIHIKNVIKLLKRLREKLFSKSAHIEMYFPYFLEKKSPVSGIISVMEYEAFILASYSQRKRDLIVGVGVPVMTLCPCSKSISKYSAHNQRGKVTIKVRFKKFIWLEELIEIAESSASSPVYSLLKRPDEKFVTEKAYENPKFVEDVVRSVAKKLLEHPEITWFSVSAENFESIHAHNVYAFIERTKS